MLNLCKSPYCLQRGQKIGSGGETLPGTFPEPLTWKPCSQRPPHRASYQGRLRRNGFPNLRHQAFLGTDKIKGERDRAGLWGNMLLSTALKCSKDGSFLPRNIHPPTSLKTSFSELSIYKGKDTRDMLNSLRVTPANPLESPLYVYLLKRFEKLHLMSSS